MGWWPDCPRGLASRRLQRGVNWWTAWARVGDCWVRDVVNCMGLWRVGVAEGAVQG